MKKLGLRNFWAKEKKLFAKETFAKVTSKLQRLNSNPGHLTLRPVL